MPVTFVSSHAGNGGSEKYLELLLGELGPAWIRSVVCLEEGPFVARLQQRGIAPHVIRTSRHSWGIAASAVRLRRLLRQERPALVHANGVKAALVCALAPGPPVVWLKHDFSRDGWLARLLLRRCNRVIAVSEAVTETFGTRSLGKLSVVHNALPAIEAHSAEGRRRLLAAVAPAAPETIVVLVGRLDPYKGHTELFAALPWLQEELPGLHVAFIGGVDPAHPAFAEHLRAETSRRGLGDAVTFLGHRDDAVRLVAGADVLAIPSRPLGRFGREGLPYVVLEAMAVGTPVVAYRQGGIPEALGQCGLLVPLSDRSGLAEAIVRVVRDEALRARLIACGKERVATEFSFERMMSETKGVYLSVADRAR
ncbi:MAG: glycosyltransferase family 4 protein [Gaiellaceae bacterium]